MNPPLVRRRLRLVAANLFACVLVLMAAEGVLVRARLADLLATPGAS